MREVAVIGAGELGGAVAHVVARRDIARSIVIVDDGGRVAAGKALDIAQAAPIEGFATQLTGTTDIASAAGASVIVIADRMSGAWPMDDAALILKRLAASAPGAVIVCAGANHRELVERGVRDAKIDRRRLFGTAPEALAHGARALVALALNGSPRDVALSLLGVPPAQTVIPWEDATAGGLAITRQLDEPTRRAVAARVNALWPPGPYALASAAALAIEVMAGRSRRRVSCFVAPDTASGVRERTAALPVRLSASGIAEVLLPSLSVAEQIALENAIQL
jgi:malate dehydrogenase